LAFAGASVAAAALMMAIGLVWGTSTGYASARVAGERERNAIAANALGVTRQLAALRRELARTREGLAHLAASQGTVAHLSLVAAEADVDSMTANVARIEHTVTATGAPEGAVFAVLRTMPVRTALAALTCGPVTPPPRVAAIQKGIPVVDLPAATAHSAETFGGIVGVRQAPDGMVLVNDARRRQLKLFDSTLTTSTVVRDSTPGSATSYGRLGTPLIPYLGDSSLIADWSANTMLVLDRHGLVVRGLDLAGARLMLVANSGYTGIDDKGRLIMRGQRGGIRTDGNDTYPDSLVILRADLDRRRIDTIGRVNRPIMRLTTQRGSDGKMSIIYTLDPLRSVDEFAVLANGSVAFVRGHDYHIDWIRDDDAPTSTPKLPFDWKRRTDDDKARVTDSVRLAQDAMLASGYPQAEMMFTTPCDAGPLPAGARGRSGGGGGGGDAPPRDPNKCFEISTNQVAEGLGVLRSPRPPLADLTRRGPIDDYDAPIRPGSTVADADGNLWVLPRTTTLSRKGELVYDVINAKGELTKRVRLPLGRAIAGFAKGGLVYLTSGDLTNGFTLERSKLPQ
jgi:hypothetical protein